MHPGHFHHLLILAQGKEWPVVPIHVVAEIKDARKTRAGDQLLFPTAVLLLGFNEITNGLPNAGPLNVPARQKPHQPPARLGSSADTPSFEAWIVVRSAAFPPTPRQGSAHTPANPFHGSPSAHSCHNRSHPVREGPATSHRHNSHPSVHTRIRPPPDFAEENEWPVESADPFWEYRICPSSPEVFP